MRHKVGWGENTVDREKLDTFSISTGMSSEKRSFKDWGLAA